MAMKFFFTIVAVSIMLDSFTISAKKDTPAPETAAEVAAKAAVPYVRKVFGVEVNDGR